MLTKLKHHFITYKREYMIGVSCLFLGGALVYLGLSRRPSLVINAANSAVNFGNGNVAINGLTGHQCKIVENLTTGDIYRSVGEAAKAAGVQPYNMSKHLNGHTGAINGEVYSILGLTTCS